MHQLLVLPLAEIEILEAASFYEAQQLGLGINFLNELDDAMSKLRNHPQHYSFISADKIFRSYSLDRFPFKLIFEILGNQVIINAVCHDKRKPLQ